MRILLFLLTNLAVVIVVGTVWRLLGFDSFLDANGVGLDFNASSYSVPYLVWAVLCFRSSSQNGWQSEAQAHASLRPPQTATKNGWFKPFGSWQKTQVLACPRWASFHQTRPMPLPLAGIETMHWSQ